MKIVETCTLWSNDDKKGPNILSNVVNNFLKENKINRDMLIDIKYNSFNIHENTWFDEDNFEQGIIETALIIYEIDQPEA